MRLQVKLKPLVFFFFLLINGIVLAQKDTLSFLHITDLHVIFNQSGYLPGMMEYRKQKQYDQGENRLREFLQTVPGKTNSDMVIATGDLVDFIEANTADNQMLNIQAGQFARLLGDYRTPVFLTLGNHDMFSFNWENNKLKHHQNNSGQARAVWVRNISCFRDGTFYSKLFRVGQTTYRFIFLDDAFYQFLPEDKTDVPYIDKSQLYWLNAQLNESDTDIEIIFMHIPFNATEAITKPDNELFSVLTKNPSVKMIFSGHHHKNIVLTFSSANEQKLIQVQTGSLVQNPENWRLVKLTEKNIGISIPGKTETEMLIPVN